jgi:ABC-type transport system involved in multi-copper enzyme maturation permease subunit
MAKESTRAFRVVSYVQLALVCFLSPVFAAGAITQERDSQTYNILISTPLSNAQIILGSLLSRLYFIVVLMFSGLPIFGVTMIYGGVTSEEILINFLVASGTALITASLAIAISVIRIGTRRTIFSFYMMFVIYLLGVYLIGTRLPTPSPAGATQPPSSFLAPLHPFMCLEAAMNVKQTPDPEAIAYLPWPIDQAILNPYGAYLALTFLGSGGVIGFCMFFVRRGTKEGELSIWRKVLLRIRPTPTGEAKRRRPRHVWANPVAWREAATREGLGRSGLRWVYAAGGLIAAGWLIFYMFKAPNSPAIRDYLMGVALVEFSVVLLVATNLAAGALTREYESETMELLLATPLTSRYIVWGKLRGLISAVLPLIAVPVGTMLAVTIAYLIRSAGGTPGLKPIWEEAFLEAGILMLAHASWAVMLGMNRSLYAKRSVYAVMQSVGILIVICALLGGICTPVMQSQSGSVVAGASPMIAIAWLTNPYMFPSVSGGGGGAGGADIAQMRVLTVIGSAFTALIVCAFVAQWYRSMVKNFDMIVRKKTR